MALTRRRITLDPIEIDGSASTADQLRVTPFPPYPSGGGEMVSGEAFTYTLPLDEDATIIVPGNYQFELLASGQTLGRTWSSGVPEGTSPIALDTLYRSTAGAVTATPVPLRVGDPLGLLSSGEEEAGRRVVTDGEGGFAYADASGGEGDMTKAVYDTNSDGIVDRAALADAATTATTATNATQLGGQTSSYHLARANHTGTQAIDTIVGLQTALDAKATATDLTSEAATRASADVTLTTTVAAKADASALTAHTGNTSNPHGVTASQVGRDTAQWNADRLDGVAVTGTPASGDVLTATGPTAATWSTPSSPSGGSPSGGWLAHWWQAVTEAATRMVRADVVGDSLSAGVATDDYHTDGWWALVRSDLQALYAPADSPGGSGWRGVFPSTAFSLTESESSHYSNYITVGPGWIGENNLFTGPGSAYIRCGVYGATVTFMLLEGSDHADVTYGILNSGHFYHGGVFEARLNGTLVATIDTNIDPATGLPSTRAAAITRTIATDIGPGPHTIEITHIGNPADHGVTNFLSVIFGVATEDAVGVGLRVFARHGVSSYAFGGAVAPEDMESSLFIDGFGQPSDYAGAVWECYDVNGQPINRGGADILAWALGVNDIADAEGTLTAYRDNLTRWLRSAYSDTSISKSASLLLVLPSQGDATQTFPRDDVAALNQRTATRYRGFALDLDIDPVQYSWTPYFAGVLDAADGAVHVNNTGARLYADAVTAILTA